MMQPPLGPQAATTAAPSAKEAILAFCEALLLLGVPAPSPEAVRQAKFGQGKAAPLWRALHDAVLLCIVGPSGGAAAASAIQRFWEQQVQPEQLGDPLAYEDDHDGGDDLSGVGQAGRDMVVQQLLAWGCSPRLCRRLASQQPHASPRSVLLALVWLTARMDLLPLAVSALAAPPHSLLQLAPLPQDTRCTAAVHAAYDAAASAAAQHCAAVSAHICQLEQAAVAAAHNTRTPPPTTRTGLSPTMPASARSVDRREGIASSGASTELLWQAVDVAANLAASLQGKLRAALLGLQSQMDAISRLNAQVQEVQTAAWPRAHPLSSCEVAMLSNALSGNAALQRACEAMRAAAACVAQQHRLVSGCHTFYLWTLSVVEAMGNEDSLPISGAASGSAYVPALATLPPAGSTASATLLQHARQKAHNAVGTAAAALGKHTSGGAHTSECGGPSVDDFVRLAAAAVPGLPATQMSLASSTASQPGTQHKRAAEEWAQLPADVADAVDSLQRAQAQRDASERAWAQAAALQGVGAAFSGQEAHVGGEAEAERLLSATLGVARALAVVRSSHKHALQTGAASLGPGLRMLGL